MRHAGERRACAYGDRLTKPASKAESRHDLDDATKDYRRRMRHRKEVMLDKEHFLAARGCDEGTIDMAGRNRQVVTGGVAVLALVLFGAACLARRLRI